MFIIMFILPLYATPLLLDQEVKEYNLVPMVEVYIDENRSRSIDDIVNNRYKFQQNTKDLLYYHFSHARYWFKFSLQNKSAQELSYKLSIPTAWLDDVTLYTLKKDGSYGVQRSGDHVKDAEKSVSNRSIVFSLHVPEGTSDYCIKIESDDALQLPMFLVEAEQFQRNEDKLNLFFAFVAGIIFMMFMYALFYFIYFKDYLYGIYMGYIITFILMVLGTHGYFLQYLYKDAFGFNEWMYEFSFIGYLGFMVWFAKEFLQVKSFSPRWDAFLKYLVIAHMAVLVLSPVLPYALIMEFGVYSGAVVPFILVIPAIISLRYNNLMTKIYLLGWSINIVFYTLWALSFFAILPYTLFLNNANSMGVVLELLVFSIGMVYRVESIMQSNRKLHDDLKTDALTQVLNRHAFNIEFPLRLEEVQSKGQNLYFVMLDIDNFKLYNDTYGHPQGDEALKRVAALLQRHLQRHCDKIYRLGGEEFALVLCAENLSKVKAQVESLREAIVAEKIVFEAVPTKVLTASFGLVGISGENDRDYLSVYKEADALLYEAKKQGRNCVMYHR